MNYITLIEIFVFLLSGANHSRIIVEDLHSKLQWNTFPLIRALDIENLYFAHFVININKDSSGMFNGLLNALKHRKKNEANASVV